MTIPDDFPREDLVTALTGAQPKVAVRFDQETKTYQAGATVEQLVERHAMCEDLAVQLRDKCLRNRATKYASLTEAAILAALLSQLYKTDWGSAAEMRWVIRRTASLLMWQAPPTAED